MIRIGFCVVVVSLTLSSMVFAGEVRPRAVTPELRSPAADSMPLKCLTKGMTSYCIPNTFKYQVCKPAVKQVECPVNSYCKEYIDAQGNNIAYCKYIS